jgi:hypothetical protein
MNLVCRTFAYGGVAMFVGLAPTVLAQEGEPIGCEQVPTPIMAVFTQTYPNATVKGCAKEADDDKTLYEIESVDGDASRNVIYDDDGQVIVIEELMNTASLPEPVQQAVREKAPKGEIEVAKKLTRGASVSYELQIQDAGKSKEIVFDPKGNELQPE